MNIELSSDGECDSTRLMHVSEASRRFRLPAQKIKKAVRPVFILEVLTLFLLAAQCIFHHLSHQYQMVPFLCEQVQ